MTIYSGEDLDNLADLAVQSVYDMLDDSHAITNMLDTDTEHGYDEGVRSLYKVVISRVINKLRIIEHL